MRRLRRGRFATARQHCTVDDNPGILPDPEWRIWVAREPTHDQRNIERELHRFFGPDKSLFHVGVGNSELARNNHRYFRKITGITLDIEEQNFAEAFSIPNYKVFVQNKYSRSLANCDYKFDVIVENSPGCFTCCLFHFCRLMVTYREMLREGGVLLSAEPGLSWSVEDDPTWWLSWKDWSNLAAALNLKAQRLSDLVYCMERQGTMSRAGTKLPILMYHSVSDSGPAELSRYRVSPKTFVHQLHYLRSHGYTSLPLREWASCIERGVVPSGRPVIITFDDAYKDFLTNALPALSENGFTATVFVVTERVGSSADWDGEAGSQMKLMDWDDLRHIKASGMEVQSHCANHVNLLEMSDIEIRADAQKALSRLRQELAIEAYAVAQPWGLSDARVRNLLAEHGYSIGLAASGGCSGLTDDVMDLPRVEICGEDGVEMFAHKIGFNTNPDPLLLGGPQEGERDPPVLSADAASAIANRIEILLDDLLSIRAALSMALAPAETVEGRLSGLFLGASTPRSVPVVAYDPIAPGVWFGFQPTASLVLSTGPRQGSREHQGTVTAAFAGQSAFLTLEVAGSWKEVDASHEFRLDAVIEPNRVVRCEALLRFPIDNGQSRDFPFARFDLLPGKRVLNLEGELIFGDMAGFDRRREPLLLILFDSDTPLSLCMDSLNFRFVM
jgi:peptidoglycan/xylan/chitin deacetylase (PgdA/CDA1 family)